MNAPKITDFGDLPKPQINRFTAPNGVNVSVVNGCEQDIFQLLIYFPEANATQQIRGMPWQLPQCSIKVALRTMQKR